MNVLDVRWFCAVQIPTNKEQAQLMVLLGTRFLEEK